jgi:hypothetical protein
MPNWYNTSLTHTFNTLYLSKAEAMANLNAMRPPESSHMSDSLLDLTSRITGLAASIDQELGELAILEEELSTKVEVVKEIRTTIQDHISTLRKAANLRGKSQETPPLSYQHQFVQVAPGAVSEVLPVVPFAVVEGALAEPVLLQPDQELAYLEQTEQDSTNQADPWQ